jgi:hypothetical protein
MLSPPSSGPGGKVRYPNDYLAAFGLIAETYPRELMLNQNVSTSGDYRFCAIGLEAGDAISNVLVFVAGAAAAVTLARAGIYSPSTLALLASSANQSGLAWGAAGWVAVPLSATWTVPATGVYYVGMLFVAGAGPSMAGAGAVNGADVVSPPGNVIRTCGRQVGLADLPNPLVPAAGNFPNYAAVY